MLVCNVSLRPPRAGITADIAEAVTATDATATGNVVFATLVDDPASVAELVDAYLGEIMVEVASVTDTIDAGLVYAAQVDEAATAVDTPDGAVPTVYSLAVVESATATDLPNASTAASAAKTATGTTPVGPLFAIDTTFPSAKLTVINIGKP